MDKPMSDFENIEPDGDDSSAFDWLGWRHMQAELSALNTVLERKLEALSTFKTFEPMVEALNDELLHFVNDISDIMDQCEDDVDAVIQCISDLSQEQSYLCEALDGFQSSCDEVLDSLKDAVPPAVFADLSNLATSHIDEVVKAAKHFANVLAGAVSPPQSLLD